MVIADSIYSNLSDDLQRNVYNAGFMDMDHRRTKSKSSTLEDRASLLGSLPGTFIYSEWQLSGAEYCSTRTSCICGQSGLKHRYILTNDVTHISISVGGNCLLEHFRQEPREELIDFSRESESKAHIWLGQKYDAFIFFSLGFKKATSYFKMRHLKQPIPNTLNQKLRDDLKISLYLFNFKKWQERLERGNKLLRYLKKSAIAAQFNGSKMKRFTKLDPITDPVILYRNKMTNGLKSAKQAQTHEEKNKQIRILTDIEKEVFSYLQVTSIKAGKKRTLSNEYNNFKENVEKFKEATKKNKSVDKKNDKREKRLSKYDTMAKQIVDGIITVDAPL